ncbi:hypothetical protein FRB99_007985 [Tulasnella sp. 403]|nr:hypothetical protein FRB99_007985 [Tulasnella sp. 403]
MTPAPASLQLVRRYLDPSRETFLRHLNVDSGSFNTTVGTAVMQRFQDLAAEKNLDEFYGCAPQSYQWDFGTYSPNSPNHILSFYMNTVVPDVVITKDANGISKPYIVLLNNGFIRGPIYAGEFTKDDVFASTPYKQRFSVLRVPKIIAEKVLDLLDGLQGDTGAATSSSSVASENTGSPEASFSIANGLTQGYVTKDSCVAELGPGDDEVHAEPGLTISFPPQFVHSRSTDVQSMGRYDLVDFVTIARLEDRVWRAVSASIKYHNELSKVWRLGKPIDEIEQTAWQQYGNVDSSEAVKEYAKNPFIGPYGT